MLHKKLVPLLVNVMLPLKGAVQLVLLLGVVLAVGKLGVVETLALVVLVQPFTAVTVTV